MAGTNTAKALKAMAQMDNHAVAALLTGSGYQNLEAVASKNTASGILSSSTKMALYDSSSGTAKNELYEIMDAFFINMINVARARDLTSEYSLMDYYYEEYEYTARRLALYPLKGVDPKFKNIPRAGVNMQAFRVPEMRERQSKPNWNYQNYASWQSYQIKKAVDGGGAVGRLYSGMLSNMLDDRNLAFTRAFREVMNKDIGIAATGLKPYQTVTVPGTAIGTDGKYTQQYALNVIGEIQDIIADMQATDTSDKWNNDPNGFTTVSDISNLVLLVRPQLLAAIRRAPATIYHDGRYDLPVQPIPWANFGGLEPYADAEFTTAVVPTYDSEGTPTGWETQPDTGSPVAIAAPYWKDTNATIDFLLYDRSRYAFISHNSLTMAPAPFNVAGAYVTHWLNEIEGHLFSDYMFNTIRGVHSAA